MSKPFNFEEFKAGKPAKIGDNKIEFIAYDEELIYPVLYKVTRTSTIKKNSDSCTLDFLQENATMLPSKRIVWIAIIKTNRGNIAPIGVFYETKEEAIKICGQNWIVIDAIPYEIEE